MLGDVEVFGIVESRVHSVLNTVDDSGLQINQKSARNVMLVISLIEENIFPVVALSSVLLKDSIS